MKYRGEIKIRHRPTQSDAASGVSSANSNVSKAMSSGKPKKPQAGGKRSRQSSTALNTSNTSSVAASSAASSTASPPTSKSKRNRRAPDYFGFESSVCRSVTTLLHLYLNDRGQQTRSLRPLFKKWRHSLQ